MPVEYNAYIISSILIYAYIHTCGSKYVLFAHTYSSDPRRSVNPDEAVCQGAGIWAGILDGVIDDMQVHLHFELKSLSVTNNSLR